MSIQDRRERCLYGTNFVNRFCYIIKFVIEKEIGLEILHLQGIKEKLRFWRIIINTWKLREQFVVQSATRNGSEQTVFI